VGHASRGSAGTDLLRKAGLTALALFVLWSVAPALADAAKCGGRKATMTGNGKDNVLKAPRKGVQVIVAGGGDDVIIAKRNKDIICAGPGNDRIFSGPGRDKVFAGGGDDFIDLGPGSDKSFLGAGDDVAVGGGGGDTIHGEGGADRLFGGIQDDKMFGGGGADLLVGNQGIDKLKGGSDDDWLRGDTNQDKYFGDAGTDTASFAGAMPPGPLPRLDGVAVDLRSGSARGDDSGERVRGIENVIGSLFPDELIGAGGTVRGGGGADVCVGFASSDCGPGQQVAGGPIAWIADPASPDPGLIFYGGPGADNVTVSKNGGAYVISGSSVTPGSGCTGGGGSVTCQVPGADLGYVLLWGGAGNDTMSVGGGMSSLTGVKADGGPGDDTINGGPFPDLLFPGESGSDRLFGNGGDDALAARGGGGDLLSGGPGNDNLATDDACGGHVYVGGKSGADVAGFAQAGAGAGVFAKLGGTAVRRGAGGCNPTKLGGGLEVLEGTRNADVLIGDNSRNLIIGREGNDVLDGRGGKDDLRGDGGNDRCPDRTAIKSSC
jgi:Ca2+-binding RTX toxin-like protein